MSRYKNLNKKLTGKPDEKVEYLDEAKTETKIFTGIIHCKGVDITVEYDWKEFDERYNKPLLYPVPEERALPPRSPYSTMKDENKNEFMDFGHDTSIKTGLSDALEHEAAFRVAKIRFTRKILVYPYNLTNKTKGFLYDDTFLDIFPERFAFHGKNRLVEGYKLVMVKKYPFMTLKENFIITQTLNPQMEMGF